MSTLDISSAASHADRNIKNKALFIRIMKPDRAGIKIKRSLRQVIVVLVFTFLFISGKDLLSQSSGIQLTPEETQWIENNPTIRVANELDWPPFDFSEDGKPMGYSIDLIKIIGEKTGLKLEFINGYTWSELLEKFEDGEIDVLPAFYLTEERKTFIAYTESYASNPSILVTHSGISEVSSLEDFKGRTIAVISGYATAQALEERYPEIERVYVNDAMEGLNFVSLGKADGFIESLGTISFLVDKNFIPNIRVVGDVGLKQLQETQLYIGVLKEKALLRDILQKGLANIGEDEMKVIRKKWIPITAEESRNMLGPLNALWQIVLLIIGGFLLLYFILRWIFKKTIKEEIALQFGSRKFRVRSFILLGILVIFIAGMGWMSIMYIKVKFSESIQLQLENDLKSANGRLEFWLAQKRSQLKLLGHDQQIIDNVNALQESFVIEGIPDPSLSRNLKEIINEHDNNINSIINHDYVNLVTLDENYLGKQNTIALYNSDILDKAFMGQVMFIPPILDKLILDKLSAKSKNLSSMYFVIPVEDSAGVIKAVMIQQINPARGFSEILQLSHVGETGESYVFDRIGRMLSVSRFEDDLKNAGLFQEDQLGELHIEVKDPGGNLLEGYQSPLLRSQQPLTFMAQSAVKGINGVDVEGYNDYRGIPVCGAWLWIDEMELGLATEIDVEEAYNLYHFIRLMALFVMGITVIFIVGSLLFTLTLGERANKALIRARDELEDRVVERTEELYAANQQIQGIVDSLADALIIINEKGIIESFSPSATKMFLYTKEQIAGLNISVLMPSPHSENHDNYIRRYIETGEAKIIGNEREVEAVRSDGSKFPARLVISEVNTENTRLFVGLIGDLTERKKAEKRLKSQSAALKSAANGIVITNTLGEIEWVNPAFTKLTGYTWKEVIGENPRVLNSGKHDMAYFENMWETVLKGGVWHDEIINKKKNGDLFHEEMTITPILNDEQEIVQFVAIKQDITERKRLEEIVIKAKQRMEDELNVAKDIQMSMLPLIFPAFPQRGEIDIHADLIPAREVGGDFYDFYFLDENHICFVVGDVSGKGVPAALMMAVTKTLLKSRAGNDKSTASILTHVNNEIAKDNDTYMFITVFIAILNTNTGELVYSNAGHNPSFIIKHDDKEVVKLSDLHGPVIGAMEEMTYSETKLNIDQNDIVIAYTDGVTESQNKKEELYSDAKFVSFLEDWEYSTPKSLIEEIIKSVKDHEDGAEQFDDITALAVQFCHKPNAMVNDNILFRIKNEIQQINTAVENFEAFGEKNSIPLPIVQKFNIAFDELLNNIIVYGYNDEGEHEIEIDVELKGERLVINIADDGIPFNPFKQNPPDTMLSVEERNVGGLGIHIVKNLMDEYNYKRNVDKNIITLVKHNINDQ